MRRRLPGWLAGLPFVAALAGGAMLVAEPDLAEGWARRSAAIVEATAEGAEPWLRVTWQGRDAVAEGEAGEDGARRQALGAVASIPGLRRIIDRTGLVAQASPFVWTASRRDETTFALAGHRPAELGRSALDAMLATALPARAHLVDEARAARGAAPDFPARAAFALAQLARLAPGGRVSLTGSVLALDGEASSADDAAALRTALASPPSGLSLDRTDIAAPLVDPFTWTGERLLDGSIRLGGFVASAAARTQVLAAASEAADGAEVSDGMALARGLPSGVDGAALPRLGGEILGLLAQGRVRLLADRLSVEGEAVDDQAVGEIEDRLATLPRAGLRRGEVSLRPRPVVPYRTTIRREPGRVILGGHLPDLAARADLLDAIGARVFGERILDRSRVAPGAPPGLVDALGRGLDGLALLASGSLEAEGRTLTLTGESLYPQTAARLRAQASRLAPSGWTPVVAVSGPPESPVVSATECQARLAATLDTSALRFPAGGADLAAELYPALDAVASLAGSCPGAKLVIMGYADPPGLRPPPPPEGTGDVAKPTEVKPTEVKPAEVKPRSEGKAPATRPAAKASAKAPAPEPKPVAKVPDGPDPELPRRRAAAVVDYLLKAGVAPGRMTIRDAGSEGARQVTIALQS